MQARRDLRNSYVFSNGYLDDPVFGSSEDNGYATIEISSSSSSSSFSSAGTATLSPSSPFSPYGDKYIEHHVSKMDTLAGVAIKYGVEVADIKRLNGLVTDIQMFAHKSLQIPLPGRHPPSTIISNGSIRSRDDTPPRRSSDDILYSFQSLKLKPPSQKGLSTEGTEMSVLKSKKTFSKDETLLRTPPHDPPLSLCQKTESSWNFLSIQKDDITVDITEPGKPIRHCQKNDVYASRNVSDILLKEESNGGLFSARGSGLALRSKPGSRGDGDSCRQNSASGNDSLLADVCVSVRKSSSTTNLSEFERSSLIWPTSKWYLKADVVSRPIADGLPKPATARRNYKAAID